MSDEIPIQKRTFSRREMHDLVWSTPIQQLASRFGLSDKGLAKTCLRHQVPVPGRGYWARLEAGQKPTKTPLMTLDNPDLEPVHIGSHKRVANPYVLHAMERAKEAAVSASKPTSACEESPSKGAARSQEPVVLERVRTYHAAISGLNGELQSMKPNQHGEVAASGLRVTPGSVTRAVTFLHHLFHELEFRGLTVRRSDRSFVAKLGPDDVSFELSEARRREKHTPTAAEQKKRDDYERRREVVGRRGEWLPHETFWPEYDYIHEGKLSLEVMNWADGARKRWSDGRTQSLESMLAAIADGILYHIHYERARREEREAAERHRKHLAHRRELHEKRVKREAKRQQFLQRLAEDQREAFDLRKTIGAASSLLAQASPEYRRMIGWAQERLQILESHNDLEVLSAVLREQNLFPDPDDLFDPEGDPPPRTNSWDP